MFNHTDFNKYLYHFTSANCALLYILPSQTLKLASIVNTNDPRENKSYGFGEIYSNFETFHKGLWAKVNFESFLKEKCRISCFSQDYTFNHNQTNWLKFGYDHPNMWAHYADNYRGVCLVLKESSLLNKVKIDNERFFFDTVSYEDLIKFPPMEVKPYYESEDIKLYFHEYVQENHKTLFFQKFKHWSYEHEKRLLHLGSDEYFSIKDCLKGIIVGLEFDKKLNPLLKKLSNPDLWIGKIIIDDGRLLTVPYDLD